VKKIRALTEEELLAVPWLPDAVGRRVYDRLHSPSPPARTATNFTGPVTVSSWSRDE
jgi:hypothetical protein